AYKTLANALYGVFGAEGFRFYDVSRASRVTAKGRELIQRAFAIVESMGFEALYGDTDSIFVTGWSDDLDLLALEAGLNSELSPYRVKLERKGDIYLLAKKRYIFRSADGKTIYRGVETVRGDWARLFKEVVSTVVEKIFEGRLDEIRTYLEGVRSALYAGRLDESLVVCKSFNPTKEYRTQAEHVRAARKYSAVTGTPLEAITEVCYVYVPYGDGVEPVVNGRIPKRLDYDRYWSRLAQLVKRLVQLPSPSVSGFGVSGRVGG
ncbi:MAG: DNA polymerase domain-containing protein, partial [Thermofilaceae archaeon]